ncbi:MAG: hypothetical protein ABIQ16_26860 [Polyangiaceae bacterium]
MFSNAPWVALALVPLVAQGACTASGPSSAMASGGASGAPTAGATGGATPDGGAAQSGGASGTPSATEGGASGFCALGERVEGAVVPSGFCVRRFASITEARTLVFAPNGDLFVAAPSLATPGGAASGLGQIVVAVDDDHDGVAELSVFADQLADVHGLAIGGGYIYFTTATTVFRTPYVPGQRKETGPREDLKLPGSFTSGRWTHGLARSVNGVLLASKGEYAACGSAAGTIASIGDGTSTVVAAGFRNPMYLRCHYRDDLCAADELGEDQALGATERFVVVRSDADFGYPCCYGAGIPAPGVETSSCQTVTAEAASFPLSDTPFGFDWARENWPAPYAGGLFFALHGSHYSTPIWQGARIAFKRTDPASHLPIDDVAENFVTGFGPAGGVLERPADVAFAPDGRMFFADDQGGAVYWVAPDVASP